MAKELYIGLMSGTSLDAVDAVIVSINQHKTELVHSYSQPIPDELRQQILAISTGQDTTLKQIGLLDHTLGKLYANTVLQLLEHANLDSTQITAIGNHGQTVFHNPIGDSPFTLQLGDANIIAAMTGIDTIADFRRMDIALGGQGAPLAPAFHQYLFAKPNLTTAVLNVGGIANITIIGASGTVSGFDTGPGNMLMDAWCEKHKNQRYDHNAQWALQGNVNEPLLKQLLSDPYLANPPPKSTGREHYNLEWLAQQGITSIAPVNVQRTLCEFTAASIAHQLQDQTNHHNQTSDLLVCGGGASNPLLMQRLKDHLHNWRLSPTSERGVPESAMEAMAFAWLARQRIHNLPSNLPSVTGASQFASLGVIYPAIKDFS